MRSKLFLVLVIFLIFQSEFNCYGAEDPDSEIEVTTKKSGFFKGIKKFFGGGSSKTTEAPTTSTTTTTTPKPTTTVKPTQRPLPAIPNQQQPFGAGDLPGFPPRQQPQPNKPGIIGLSYPSTRPPSPTPSGPKLAPMLPITSSTSTTTTTTTTVKPTVKVEQTSTTTTTTKKPVIKEDFPALPTTTRKPSTPKEDFPALPTRKNSGPVAPSPTPSLINGNAWSTPGSPTQNRVSFITTPKPANVPISTTTHRPGHIPNHVPSSVPPPSSTTVKTGSGKSLVTDAELSQVSELIFAKETNSKLSNLHIDLQGKTKSFETKDEAPKPLFNPDDQALRSNSITKMMQLFNNYELDTTVNEHVTPMERSEENQFLDIIMVSGVMRQTMLFLQNKGIVSPDPAKHRELVKTIWFTLYSRGLGKIGSSAFEHVFLNEIKNGTVIGLHNWVYFLEQEKAGKLDYMGYLRKVDLGTKAMVIESRFSYNGLMKPVNSMFVGTSPELEIALYTLCFTLRADEDCPLTLGGQKVNIVTYTWKYRGNKLIGSAYPDI